MIADPKTIGKLESIYTRYKKLCFEKVIQIPCEIYQTTDFLSSEPENVTWKAIEPDSKWGDNKVTGWFRGKFVLPSVCTGQKTFLRGDFDSPGQAFIKVNNNPLGAFDSFHPVVKLDQSIQVGSECYLSIEAYAFHSYPGHSPNCKPTVINKDCKTFKGIELVTERQDVSAFCFDLQILLDLLKVLSPKDVFYGKIIRTLVQIFAGVVGAPDQTVEADWRPKLKQACDLMKPILAAKNASYAPEYGMVGNSHIDTAWLWPLAETIRKCARTFSSVSNLIDEFPEFKFIQSAPCHAEMMRLHYPEVFEKLKAKIASGNIEPNGAMWVEPDANLTSGESFIRQFLVGHKTTRELFGYVGDTLWLPDVFGYSATLPQIMKGCGVDYFCTQKISWNDTTRFPYDLFHWKGIDGTEVLTHFLLDYIISPTPKTITDSWNNLQHSDSQDRQLCAFGWGDGGGGPTRDQLQVLRRMKDLQGVPKCEYTSVSEFMQRMEKEVEYIPLYVGELYLEGHRGTLTSIGGIKRGNRFSEIALRNCEIVSALAFLEDQEYPTDELLALWKLVLTNQFHDILPGSSIAIVNDEAIQTYQECLAELKKLIHNALTRNSDLSQANNLLCFNSLSWNRSENIVFDATDKNFIPANSDLPWQQYEDLDQVKKTVVSGLNLASFSSEIIELKSNQEPALENSAFEVLGNKIETPFATVILDSKSGIKSFWDKQAQRQLVRPNRSINEFLMGEDVPNDYDNWDIDRDQALKLKYELELVNRQVISDGPLQLRVRSEYKISQTTTIYQDMIFYANTAQVDFETKVNWQEKYQLLKVAFPTDLHIESARHEIQFGYIERPTHTNRPEERAQFEVLQHKWTDMSEGGYGIALLNDCKYGISTLGSELRLTLLKSGIHPDGRGDAGIHHFTYSFLPHNRPFNVVDVIRPAYQLNMPILTELVDESVQSRASIFQIDCNNVILETVKLAEEDKALIVRVYETGKMRTNATLSFGLAFDKIVETNMIEEPITDCDLSDQKIKFKIKPFEIKTFKCYLA